MKRQYDFSKGVRGKFYKANTRLHLPVYLDSEVRQILEQIARNKRSDISTVVNQLLRSNIRLAQTLQ